MSTPPKSYSFEELSGPIGRLPPPPPPNSLPTEAELLFEFCYQLRVRRIPFKLDFFYRGYTYDCVVPENNKVRHVLSFRKSSHKGMKVLHETQPLKLHYILNKRTFQRALEEICGDDYEMDEKDPLPVAQTLFTSGGSLNVALIRNSSDSPLKLVEPSSKIR